MIALFRAIIDQFSLKIFLITLILVSCPQQNVHSSSRSPSLFLSSLESFSVLLLQAKLGGCFALWFALTPPPLKWLTEHKNPFEVCKLAARYNEFGYEDRSHKMNLIDTSTNSPHYFYWKCIGIKKENLNLDVKV